MRAGTLTPQAASMRRNIDTPSSLKHRTPTTQARALRSRRGIMVETRTPHFITRLARHRPVCTELSVYIQLFVFLWRACTFGAGYRYLQLLCVITLSMISVAFYPAFDSGIQGNPGTHSGMACTVHVCSYEVI